MGPASFDAHAALLPGTDITAVYYWPSLLGHREWLHPLTSTVGRVGRD